MSNNKVLKVAVLGAAGRMGQAVCGAVIGDESCELAAVVDAKTNFAGQFQSDVVIAGNLGELPSGLDVVVDFTVADAVLPIARWCAKSGVHLVSGTTGLDESEMEELGSLFEPLSAPNCVLAPNFAISAVLLMHLARVAAPFFDTIEIVELHHDAKRDAPSGTAIETARQIALGRDQAGSLALRADPTTQERIVGSRGAIGPGDIRVHALRLNGLVAHEEVLFGTTGQTLTIRQDSYDRTSFMPGVLMAIKGVAGINGLTVGLGGLLGL